MEQRSPGLRWGVERRLEFIEFRLFWEGAINRSDLIDFFGVSVPQASKDLSLYQERAPGNMEYDKSEKRYFVARGFKPRFQTPDADQYLSQLRSVGENLIDEDETWISRLPPLGCMPIPHRQVEPAVLQSLLAAIREEDSIEIHYQSMNPQRPEPIWRSISPHAFGHDGFRWHARAFCHVDGRFKDFLLSRCLDTRKSKVSPANRADDFCWHETVDLKLIPNPKLSKSQQKIIAHDYSMDKNQLHLSMRKALLYYFQKRLRLDVAEALDGPQEVPVVIANKDAFDKALAEAMA
jgi:WYL domain